MARVVIMGVAGAGKTTVGNVAAELLDFPFVDADDLHSPADRASMASGEPLDDHRRDLWIERVRRAMEQHSDVVLACSALRRRHRDQLRRIGPLMFFLDVPAEEVARRLRARHGHFFPAALLTSQFAALDPVESNEGVIVLDGAQPVAVLANAIVANVRLRFRSSGTETPAAVAGSDERCDDNDHPAKHREQHAKGLANNSNAEPSFPRSPRSSATSSMCERVCTMIEGEHALRASRRHRSNRQHRHEPR